MNPYCCMLKTYSKRTWKIVFGAIKMRLNFNLKPKYDLHMYQNFVLHIFELHRYAWFHVRMWSMFGSEKVTFCENCRIQKTRQIVVLKIFWLTEIVSMDPKSNVKLSGNHFLVVFFHLFGKNSGYQAGFYGDSPNSSIVSQYKGLIYSAHE